MARTTREKREGKGDRKEVSPPLPSQVMEGKEVQQDQEDQPQDSKGPQPAIPYGSQPLSPSASCAQTVQGIRQPSAGLR